MAAPTLTPRGRRVVDAGVVLAAAAAIVAAALLLLVMGAGR